MSIDTTRTSKYFLVCAGGTGMRCLQSFINMCSVGMFAGQTIDVLLLDTDAENKDKKNTENLIQKYSTTLKTKTMRWTSPPTSSLRTPSVRRPLRVSLRHVRCGMSSNKSNHTNANGALTRGRGCRHSGRW